MTIDPKFVTLPEGYQFTDDPPRSCLECMGTGYSDLIEVECARCFGTGYQVRRKKDGGD